MQYMTVMTMQMMRSDEYLIKCAEKRMESYMHTADKTAHKISDVYQNALRELKRPLESIFKGLSVGISNAEVKRILNVVDNTDIDELFKKAVENISDPDTKQIMQNEFKRPAIKAKVNQIKSLSEKIKATCKAVIESTTKLTDDCLSELIPYAYYHSAYDKQHSSGMGMFLPLLTEERIDEIRLTNWSGIRYPERIRNNSTRLADLLTAEVLTGFLTKKNQIRMAEIMAQRIAEAFNRSYTLLRTEACFVTNQAELQSYVDNAVQKYRYVAVLDMRTSKMCRLLDGQEFDVDKAIVGINFPPLHPHCRSTTRPIIDGEDLSEQERNAIDPETGETMTVPADMTYGEWYEKYVDKSAESGIIKEGSDEVGLSLKIDRFTPCLIEKSTGKIINTRYTVATKNELESLKKQGWNFDWTAEDLKDTTVYKLTIDNDHEIQGLVALKDMPNDYSVYLKLAESALHNIGNNKSYEGVGGHLFAIAAQTSVDKGYGGFIYFEAKNIELVQHYQEAFGGKLIGGVHQYRMIIDEDAAKELLSKYTLKGE